MLYKKHLLLGAVIVSSLAAVARAEDAYYRVPFKDLDIIEGKMPEPPKADGGQWPAIPNWRLMSLMQPYSVIEGTGEAYVRWNQWPTLGFAPSTVPGDDDSATDSAGTIYIRAPRGAEIAGLLFVLKSDYRGMTRLKFKVPAKLANDKYAKAFYQQKAQHYQALLNEGIPGGAWFRHELRLANRELGVEQGAAATGLPSRFAGGLSTVEDTFDLFSGGRAIAENLQLERATPAAKDEVATVDVSSLKGITIAEIDWKKLTKEDAKPALDPLASFIPADQHAIFFSSFAKLMEVADHADDLGTRLLRLAEPRSEDARTKERYERQLCLSTSALSRLLGPALVKSVAITGSDPYFISGTDVAALFEAVNPAALQALLTARMVAGSAVEPSANAVDGKIDDIQYRGFRSPDRKVCSYIARLGDVVVVTNSLAQLTQLVKAHEQNLATIASLPEYRFFRTRYARGAADESAFVFLSDATIRRWCGPRWRIASSRRVRDQAVMSELQAAYLDDLATHRVQPGPIHTDLSASDVGELRLGESGVTSSVLGSLDFETPIVEIPLDKVTQQEAGFYKRWRDTYQQNWSWSFDPIALVITANDKRLAGDLTVMPLILNTEYRQFLSFTQGAEIKPAAGDPHDALAHWIVAFNREAPEIRQAGNMLQSMIQAKANPLSWVGSSIAVYADDDPFWAELAKQPDERKREEFLEKNFGRLPVALHVDVASPLKLTTFIVALRGVVEQTAPGMVVWESLTYHDQPYVKLSPTERAKGELPPGIKEPALFYSISGDALIVSLNESVVKRAIDRQTERHKAKTDGKPLPVAGKPWLGSSVCLQFDRQAIGLLGGVFRNDYQEELRLHSWNNLPILTEWKRRYPDQDPVALHEKFFQTRLVCPGGGKYVWNDKWQTMESTVYGHPGEPKKGPDVPFVLSGFSDFNFGLTFEEHGLRARLDLPRETERGRGSGKVRMSVVTESPNVCVSPLRIGPLVVDPPVLQAPMAGFTNYAYRQVVREFGGAGLQATEMICAKGFLWRDRVEQELPDRLWGIEDEPRPLAVQIWDNDPATLAAVGAKLAHELHVSVVDINFGCPVKIVTQKAHSGSYLLRDPDRIGAIVERVVEACKPVPVTAKIRLGCTRNSIRAIEVAQVVESAGAAAITVHGRTAADFFQGSADWDRIAEIRPHLRRIPLIGNGDLDSPEAVVEAFRRYRVDGVMIARAALNKPWIFRQAQAALRGESIPPDPTPTEERDLLLHHFDLVCRRFGPERGTVLMRKFACCYAQGRPGVREFRNAVARISHPEEFFNAVRTCYPA